MFRRSLTALGIVGIATLFASPALAHVTIQPGEAEQGGFSTQFIQVPNERDDAQTTQVEVTFPSDHPLRFVSVQPVAGWQVAVEKAPLAEPIKTDDGEVTETVSKITWSGGEIQPGQFERFPVSLGQLPEADSLVFKAVQTYSSGEVVRWINEPTAADPEPDDPAPVLKLTAASESDVTPAAGDSAAALPKDLATTSDVDSAKTVGIIGIVLGGLGLIVALVAVARKRTA